MMSLAAMPTRKPQSEEMLTLLDRHKIQVLLEASFKTGDVPACTGSSVDTGRRAQGEVEVTHTDDKRAGVARCSPLPGEPPAHGGKCRRQCGP